MRTILYHKVSFITFVIVNLFILQVTVAQKFTIPVLPDTQCEVNTQPQMFMSQMHWIADKKDSLNAQLYCMLATLSILTMLIIT
jgi:hypothetical protein